MVQDAQSRLKHMGSSDALEFSWQAGDAEPVGSGPLGQGRLSLLLAGEVLWGHEGAGGETVGIEADWGLLLEHLAGAWPWITLEEGYSLDVMPLSPGQLWLHVQEQPGGAEALSEGEHESLIRFEHRHDLASGVDGFALPRVLVLREGSQCWLECPERDLVLRRPMEEVVGVLADMGNAIARHVANQGEAGRSLAQYWHERETRARKRLFPLRSGLTREQRQELVGAEDEAAFWEIEGDDSELMAAARMAAGSVETEVVARVVDHVRQLPQADIADLDALGIRLRQALMDDPPGERPYAQGHTAALAFRKLLELEWDAPLLDIEERLQGWGVVIRQDVFDPQGNIDALACWGPRHGPGILLNTVSGSRVEQSWGRRSTLAHELCHLLLDREGSLPLAEVLGGTVPRWIERRANAFSVELLLPREVALAAVRQASDLEVARSRLVEQYEVSQQLAANQIRNAPGFELVVNDPRDQRLVRRWARGEGVPNTR